ncbi:MAG: putative sugar O-methyltransferase [Proteobacteria bacterium]|nr:putative sugar O-methyltransferase [Pseudomonadota bacterium]MDA1310326.1 putative sugar O-methyltransferase [Pseudomonadota bacterium]
MTEPSDIADDPGLLDLMMADLNAAEAVFQPTRYWQAYQARTVEALRRQGLSGLRARRDPVFSSFGCFEGDLAPTFDGLADTDLSEAERQLVVDFSALLQRHPDLELLPLGASILDLMRSTLADLEREARLQNPKAVSIFDLDCALVGGPNVHFRVGGKSYTPSLLQAYRAYGQCMRDIDLSAVACIVEIGSGMGQQVELLKKLHPHLAYVLVDLPPQLYVSHQYLNAVFPDACAPYQETRGAGPVEIQPGRIHFLGNWRIDDVVPPGPTVLWNAKSFQEMSQPVVARYFQGFSRYCDYLHLRNLRRGLEPEMIEALGLEDAVDKDFYETLFAGDYEQIAYRAPRKLAEIRGYRIMTWKRRG